MEILRFRYFYSVKNKKKKIHKVATEYVAAFLGYAVDEEWKEKR